MQHGPWLAFAHCAAPILPQGSVLIRVLQLHAVPTGGSRFPPRTIGAHACSARSRELRVSTNSQWKQVALLQTKLTMQRKCRQRWLLFITRQYQPCLPMVGKGGCETKGQWGKQKSRASVPGLAGEWTAISRMNHSLTTLRPAWWGPPSKSALGLTLKGKKVLMSLHRERGGSTQRTGSTTVCPWAATACGMFRAPKPHALENDPATRPRNRSLCKAPRKAAWC